MADSLTSNERVSGCAAHEWVGDDDCPYCTIEHLRSQLPAEMQECTLRFMECEKGHGRLTATNWIDHGCPWCTIEQLQSPVETSVMLPDGPAPFRPTDEVIRRVCLGGMRTMEEGREIITYLRWLERRQAVEAARRTDTRLAGDIEYCLAKISPATDVHAILTEVMKDLRSPVEPTPERPTSVSTWTCEHCGRVNDTATTFNRCPFCSEFRKGYAQKAGDKHD